MTNTEELLTALTAKLNELDTQINLINEIKDQVGAVNISQLEARVATSELRYVETQQSLQALLSLFNTDHYETLPSLITSKTSQQAEIDELKIKVNENSLVIESIKAL